MRDTVTQADRTLSGQDSIPAAVRSSVPIDRHLAQRSPSATSEGPVFSDLLVALIPNLRRFAGKLTGSSDDGDDLVQSTLERALFKQHQLRGVEEIRSWVFSILHSVWFNELRARKVRRGSGFVDTESLVDTSGASNPEAQQVSVQISRLIAELPEAQRAVLLLVDVEGLSYQEVSEVVGIPKGTVMSRLARARKKLLDAMAQGPAEQSMRKQQAVSIRQSGIQR